MTVAGANPAVCGADLELEDSLFTDGEAFHQASGESLTPGTAPLVCEHPASKDIPATATVVAARHVILM
ncbi:hypothetical protein E5345_04780 [Propionibacterium sp. NM47_B9-13]|uniref:Uncharacterized protein n=2 Tax=Cutibacterium modestum TaxID=2559073 RepID=A0AAD1KQC5_9ACTN|nr:hypothetical protein [Cutibacterium modestum]MCP2376263.1 hypothetical protein [Cutibacterium modestum 28N]MCP2381170.1 hypothetical protein [Cutibacterium modestum 30N]TGY29338.1 hypothetical protein E5345_04780 [Propionibacterium sp. NM47_B9-13]AOH44894.1 hypothetical protein BCB70_02095 [Cutibacterium modestum]EFS91742.1 hypothetical protein HMPREF9607_02253 [Cutibacterium modestum HL044PA1]